MRSDYLTERELKQGIRYLTKHKILGFSPCKIEALLLFLFYTGIRKFELLRLKRKDFDLENNIVKITGIQRREIPFLEAVKEKISTYFNSEKEKLNAFNVTARDIDIIFLVFLRECFPKKKIRFHSFRHSFIRYLIQKAGL